MDIIVCIGGTGVRCFESFLYSVAAGQVPEINAFRVLIIDKDKESGTLKLCRDVIGEYQNMCRILRDYTVQGNLKFNIPDIQIVENWDMQGGMPNNKSLREIFGGTSETTLLNSMYKDKELNIPLDRGFYGHPSIGSTLFKKVIHNDKGNLLRRITGGRNIGDENSHVFVFGSVFGGTGAAIMPNIAKFFKDSDLSRNITVSGVLMLPYFDVPDNNSNNYQRVINDIKGEDFLFKCITALKYYDSSNIVKINDSDNACFDSLYLLGLLPLAKTSSSYNNGGIEQSSRKHFVDMYAALAACDFFNNKNNPRKGAIALRIFPNQSIEDFIDWKSIPNEDNSLCLLDMLRFSAVVIQYLYNQLILYSLEDLREGSNVVKAMLGRGIDENGNEIVTDRRLAELTSKVQVVFSFCIRYVEYISELCDSNYDFLRRQPDPEAPDLRLFNRAKVMDLLKYAKSLISDEEKLVNPPVPNLETLSSTYKSNRLTLKQIDHALNGDLKYEGNFYKFINDLYTICKIKR